MGLVFIDVLAVDVYKRYDIAALPLSHSGRLQGERISSFFPVIIVFAMRSGTHNVLSEFSITRVTRVARQRRRQQRRQLCR